MANVMFKKGLLANLPATFAEGTFYVTTDEHAMYLDVDGSTRIRLGDFQEFATLAALKANVNPSTTALYYVDDINCLAKWNGTDYIQINLDTGATSFEVTGEGNAVTAVSYDAATRKLTLTKGETFATAAELATADEEIRAYVDEKTKGIATDAALGELQSKVTAAEGDIDSLEAISHTHTNKTVLDGITAAKVADWDDAVSKEHEHSNKDLLDTYTQTEADLADAVSKKHSHTFNETELNKIAEGDVAKWNAAEQNAKDYAKSYADGLAGNYDASGAAAQALVDAKAYADGLAGNYDAAGAAAAVQTKLNEEVTRAKAAEEANAAAAKAADDKAAAAQGEIDALEGKVGTVPADKTVVQMISEAQTAATYDDTKVKEDIAANAEAIALLNDGSTVEGSVDYKIAQAVAAIMENPDDTMNSINELVTWINGHAEDALELSNKVTANEGDIAALEGLVGTEKVADQISAAIAAALKIDGVDKYALASDLTAAIARIAAMEAKVSKWDAAEQNAKDYADGLNTAMNTRVEALEAIDHEHENKAVLDGITAAKVSAWDGAQAAAEATAAAALASAKSELEGKISAAQAAAEKVANDNDAAMDTRVKALEAIDHEAYKGYADQAETDAVAAANAYTDSQVTAALTWGSF